MPRTTPKGIEISFRRLIEVDLLQHAHAPFVDVAGRCDPLFPYDTDEEGARAVHYCYIWESPVTGVALEVRDYFEPEGVIGRGAEGVVGDAGGRGAVHPGWVDVEIVDATSASLDNTR